MNETPGIFTIRNAGTYYEILVSIQEHGGTRIERWEPLATTLVKTQCLRTPRDGYLPLSLFDALQSEGWTPPS